MPEENLMFVLLSKTPQPITNPQIPQPIKIGVDLVFSPNLQSAFKTMMNKSPNISFEYVGEKSMAQLETMFNASKNNVKVDEKPKGASIKILGKEIIVAKQDPEMVGKSVSLYFQYLLEDDKAEAVRAKLTSADLTDLKRISKKLK